MRSVSLQDVIGLSRYEQIRDEFRRRTIEIKKHRRVGVGDRITFVFENFDTVLFQIQEMLRAERIVDLDRVRDELDVYNVLMPGPGELSATMLIELEDPARVREELPKFYGIDECVWLEIDGERTKAVFEGGRIREDKVSAVQYVRFPLGPAKARFLAGAPTRIVIDHPGYRAIADLSHDVQSSLVADFEGS